MNPGEWPPSWLEMIGDDMPSSYCAMDIETTGFSKDYDLIVEYGHCLVDDGKVVDKLNLVLDWTRHPIIPQDWLANQIEYVRRRMADKGKKYHMTMKRMAEEGMDPIKGLNFIYEFLSTLRSNDSFFVTHNGYRFDEDMLAHSFVGFEVCTGRFSFGDFALFDTESIEKSRVCPKDPKARVRTEDTLRSWCRRLSYANMGRISTNLAHCADKYQLPQKYGVDMSMSHTAGFDSYVTHLLYQEQRAQRLAAAPVIRPEPPRLQPQQAVRQETQPLAYEVRRRRGQRNR